MADNDVKKMVRLDYNAYLADADRLYDTTSEEVAKEAGIYNEKYTYSPMAYIVGSGKLFPALEAAIAAAEVGKEAEVVIPSEEAAGARNPRLIEVYPAKEFYKQEINPYPGLQVTLGNRTGVVMSAGAGRVRVDFNNPLAGHDLLYKFTVTEVIEEQNDKAKAIVEVSFGDSEGFVFAFPGDKVSVTLPEITKFHQEWPVARFKVVQDLRNAFGVDTVEFIEVWSAPKKEEETKE
jgi:FKBP-type peptidyl-prolyl cis-trans isomerase 2